jgi:hypothetical protein
MTTVCEDVHFKTPLLEIPLPQMSKIDRATPLTSTMKKIRY